MRVLTLSLPYKSGDSEIVRPPNCQLPTIICLSYFCRMIIPSIAFTILFYVYCAVIAIQVFYYLYFFRRLAYYDEPERGSSFEHPVSVVICARDEADNLTRNLPGVLVQDYKTSHEIVLVNDNSADEGKYVIDEFQKSFKNIN